LSGQVRMVTLEDSKVDGKLRSPGDVLSGWGRRGEDDLVALLLQKLSVGHQLFRRRISMNVAVGAVVVEAREVAASVEELEADEVIGFHVVGDRHDCRDVAEPPSHLEVVFGSLGRPRDGRDESGQMHDVLDPECGDLDREHPGRFRNVDLMNVVVLAATTLPKSRMLEDAVGPVVELFLSQEDEVRHHAEEEGVIVVSRAGTPEAQTKLGHLDEVVEDPFLLVAGEVIDAVGFRNLKILRVD